jgi:hypothetical protein
MALIYWYPNLGGCGQHLLRIPCLDQLDTAFNRLDLGQLGQNIKEHLGYLANLYS